jgi:hypothetical protein
LEADCRNTRGAVKVVEEETKFMFARGRKFEVAGPLHTVLVLLIEQRYLIG